MCVCTFHLLFPLSTIFFPSLLTVTSVREGGILFGVQGLDCMLKVGYSRHSLCPSPHLVDRDALETIMEEIGQARIRREPALPPHSGIQGEWRLPEVIGRE